jgi:hypothetical protein
MDVDDVVIGKEFLGEELLLWLWYRTDVDEARFRVDEDVVEVSFDDSLVLVASLAETEQSRLKGGAPAQSPEAYKALQFGKRVSKAKLRLLKGEKEWVFVFDAQTFRKSGVKLPGLVKKDEDSRLSERMYLIEELDGAWNAIYLAFLEDRIGDAWPAVHARMRDWIAEPIAGEG